MANKEVGNVLTEEFLIELYNSAINNDYVCGVVVENMEKSYLPDRDFQALHSELVKYYRSHKSSPSFSIIRQILSGNRSASALLLDIHDEATGIDNDIIIENFQKYVVRVNLLNTYKEVGESYNKQNYKKAEELFIRFAEWYSGFNLQSTSFTDVIETFESRFLKNREKHNTEDSAKPVTRFYIDDLDEMNGGKNLRTQLTCFLAPTGVGKSHAARWIGKCASQIDGLNVLHIQLEGSEQEVLDAYSASLANCSTFKYEKGVISDIEFKRIVETVNQSSGTLKVKSYPKFNSQISTVDVRNAIIKYKKLYGMNPDVLIIDSMDLLTDSSGKNWSENGERHKRIKVAEDLKDIAGDENLWIVVTYQATIENKDWLNDEKNVLTEYNCAEAKGLARPMTHLITLNQSDNERTEETMRLHVAKSRFFKKGGTIKIATNYEYEQFYDKVRTINLKVD